MTKPKTSKQQQNFPAEFEQGRRARLAAVSRDEAPFGEGDQLDAWLAGYDEDGDPYGARARDETMTPEPVRGTGQMGTVADAKKG